MADTAETVIAAIHTYLNSKLVDDPPYEIGSKHLHQHATDPRIVWADAKGTLTTDARRGGNPASIGQDIARFEVHIWHDTRENCRIMLHNLPAAARACYGGPVVRWGDYWWKVAQDEKDTSKGVCIVVECEIRIQIDEFIQDATTVTDFAGDLIMQFPGGDETVASLDIP